MNLVIGVYVGLLGAICGSFTTALVWRLRQKRNFLFERSECEKCNHKLGVFDLIPIISWVFLHGKCRYCHKEISCESTIVEVIMSMIFLISYLFFPVDSIPLLVSWLIILVFFGILTLYDLKYRLLPNKIIIPLIIFSVGFFIIKNWNNFPDVIWEFFYALLPISGIYTIIYYLTKSKGIGMGDIKLGIALALILTWRQAILVLFLSNVLGIIFWILSRNKLRKAGQIPFGPMLILATVIIFLFVDSSGIFNLFML